MRQLSMAILMVSLMGCFVTTAMAASTTHLTLSPSALSRTTQASTRAVNTTQTEKNKTLKKKIVKTSVSAPSATSVDEPLIRR